MNLIKKLGLMALATISTASLATMAVASTRLINARADNTYTASFYARADVNGTTKYLKYDSNTKRLISGTANEAIYQITWSISDPTQCSIKYNNILLGVSTGNTFSNDNTSWSLNNGLLSAIDSNDINHMIRWNTNSGQEYAAPYKDNTSNNKFPQVYFYSQAEYDARLDYCEWTNEQKACLQKLIYPNANSGVPSEAIPANETIIIGDYAAAHSWTNGTKYTSISGLYATISVSGGGNTGKYYTSDSTWRLYQGESATITFTANKGYKITTITCKYLQSNSGTLKDSSTNVPSNTTINVNANSKTLSVGNTGSATNGQAKITEIAITYQAI